MGSSQPEDVGSSPSHHRHHHHHQRHHHHHFKQSHHHEHNIQVVFVPQPTEPLPLAQTFDTKWQPTLPLLKTTAPGQFSPSPNQKTKDNGIGKLPKAAYTSKRKVSVLHKYLDEHQNEVSKVDDPAHIMSSQGILSQVDHESMTKSPERKKKTSNEYDRSGSKPIATGVYKIGNASRLVEVVTLKGSGPKQKSQSVGYHILRNKSHLSKNAQNPLLRPKPLLDHFHGLHFGIIDPADFPQRPPVKASYSVEGTFLWAIGLFGTVENGAVLLTTIFSKKFKKPLHLLIGSLSVTDLFVSLIYIPSYTYYLLEGDRLIQTADPKQPGSPRPLSQSTISFCKLSRSIFVEIASVTLTLKALIAVYLYISACSRERVSHIFSTRNTAIYIGMAWAINFFMLFIPNFLGYPEVDFYPNSFICSSGGETHHDLKERSSSEIYTFLTLAVHMIELTIVCLCFIKVHLAIVQGKVYSDKHRSSDKQAQINYMRALKITCLVFASFCICWMPIYIINILDPTHTKLPTDMHHLVMDLLLLKSSINPTIYIYGIRSLRYEIKLLCLCRCRKDNQKALLVPKKVRSLSDEGLSRTFSTISGGV